MNVKVRFYSYDIEFEFKNYVEFPVVPAVGDEVNLISFFKSETSERLEYVKKWKISVCTKMLWLLSVPGAKI